MTLERWDPFRDFSHMGKRLSRLFEDTFWGEGTDLEKWLASGTWTPAIDVYETENDIVVKTELPEIEAKDVDVTIDDDRIAIKGERKFSDEVKEDNYYRVERHYGSFQRLIPLPATVKRDEAKAEYKDGLLKLTIPKAEEAKSKEVKVKIEEK